jgi:hypothetical protein
VLTCQEATTVLDAARRELANHVPAAPAPHGAAGDEKGVQYVDSAVA